VKAPFPMAHRVGPPLPPPGHRPRARQPLATGHAPASQPARQLTSLIVLSCCHANNIGLQPWRCWQCWLSKTNSQHCQHLRQCGAPWCAKA